MGEAKIPKSCERNVNAFLRGALTSLSRSPYSAPMNFDISQLLENWDYQPGQIVVRRFTGRDGQEKIQLRVDLGLLQMNALGRPDGKRPMGHPSLFEYQEARLKKHMEEHSSDDGFRLRAEDCAKLQLEALQFHHRYICLLELQDYEGVVRDTMRNLAVFDFVARYAESEELAWALQQFRPQLLLIQVRAKGNEKLAAKRYREAVQEIEHGISDIRQFYSETGRNDIEHSAEVQYLENWIGEINSSRPLSKREKLELALHEAVRQENYEKAAEVRDEIRNLATEE